MDSYRAFLSLKTFLANSGRGYNIDLITRAYEYAADMHEEQYRQSREEYIMHPLAVAQICANLGYGTDCVCAALLHDVVEDCPDRTNQNEITRLFGDRISFLVNGLTKLKGIEFMTKEEEDVKNIRKMFASMSEDYYVMLVKLCDRLHNMRTLEALPLDKQKRIALETMHIFAPIADRLGIKKIKSELDDLSLRYLDPFVYADIKDAIEQRFGESRDVIERCKDKIKARLNAENISFVEEGRVKSVTSIYQKTISKGRAFEEIFDFYAIRYIVESVQEVYHVLGIVHELYPYMQGRYKDYISTPKQNGYMSIHTTVTSGSVPIEVQIRTKDMHEVAEYGVAAHNNYKYDIGESIAWLRELIEADEDIIMDRDEIIANLKESFYSEDIYVYTPKGEIKTLKRGSTVIDFAYAVHSFVGNRMTGAKINGLIASIDTELDNNQRVEIIMSNASNGPSRDWLNIAKTSNARNKIRQWFKQAKRAENILIGREEIKKILKEIARPLTEEERDTILNNIAERAGFASLDDFYNAIGYGGQSVSKLYIKLKDEIERTEKRNLIFDIQQIEFEEPKNYSDGTDIIIDGLDNCSIKLAKCCNPVPGDKIYGFATKGHGLSVHKADCRNFRDLKNQEGNEGRVFSAFWNESKKGDIYNKSGFSSLLKISALDDMDLMRRIVELIHEMRVPMHGINKVNLKTDGAVMIDLQISVRDVEHLNHIINRLKMIKNIKDAGRNAYDLSGVK